jgi:hypothetical protein
LWNVAVGWVEKPKIVVPEASSAGVSSFVLVARSVRGIAGIFGIAALS